MLLLLAELREIILELQRHRFGHRAESLPVNQLLRGPAALDWRDTSECLDAVPAQVRVLVVRRPKDACRACTDGIVQAPVPTRLIDGGLPSDALLAPVLVSKYTDHCPLYRQAQILARSTLADVVERATHLLRSMHERLLAKLHGSGKFFPDETTAPVLDPGRGRAKTGELWAEPCGVAGRGLCEMISLEAAPIRRPWSM